MRYVFEWERFHSGPNFPEGSGYAQGVTKPVGALLLEVLLGVTSFKSVESKEMTANLPAQKTFSSGCLLSSLK